MTGDYTPDLMAILSADIIISTPEKWDGISRNWHSRTYVKKVQSFTYQFFFSRHYFTFINWFSCQYILFLFTLEFY